MSSLAEIVLANTDLVPVRTVGEHRDFRCVDRRSGRVLPAAIGASLFRVGGAADRDVHAKHDGVFTVRLGAFAPKLRPATAPPPAPVSPPSRTAKSESAPPKAPAKPARPRPNKPKAASKPQAAPKKASKPRTKRAASAA